MGEPSRRPCRDRTWPSFVLLFSALFPLGVWENSSGSSNCQLVQAALGDALSVQLKTRPTLAGARARLSPSFHLKSAARTGRRAKHSL